MRDMTVVQGLTVRSVLTDDVGGLLALLASAEELVTTVRWRFASAEAAARHAATLDRWAAAALLVTCVQSGAEVSVLDELELLTRALS